MEPTVAENKPEDTNETLPVVTDETQAISGSPASEMPNQPANDSSSGSSQVSVEEEEVKTPLPFWAQLEELRNRGPFFNLHYEIAQKRRTPVLLTQYFQTHMERGFAIKELDRIATETRDLLAKAVEMSDTSDDTQKASLYLPILAMYKELEILETILDALSPDEGPPGLHFLADVTVKDLIWLFTALKDKGWIVEIPKPKNMAKILFHKGDALGPGTLGPAFSKEKRETDEDYLKNRNKFIEAFPEPNLRKNQASRPQVQQKQTPS